MQSLLGGSDHGMLHELREDHRGWSPSLAGEECFSYLLLPNKPTPNSVSYKISLAVVVIPLAGLGLAWLVIDDLVLADATGSCLGHLSNRLICASSLGGNI